MTKMASKLSSDVTISNHPSRSVSPMLASLIMIPRGGEDHTSSKGMDFEVLQDGMPTSLRWRSLGTGPRTYFMTTSFLVRLLPAASSR